MKPEEVSILFMDDEIHDSQATLVRDAVAALRQQGFQVTVVEKMSDAIDEFYRKYYKIFVLDIDMSHVSDIFSAQQERGTRIAEIYRALDNGTAIVMFSQMGLAEDWFRVSNRHVFGYIHKGDEQAIEQLLELVGRAARTDTRGLELPTPRRSGPVLVCNAGTARFSEAALAERVGAAGDFTARICRFDEMARRLSEGDFSAALLVADRFDTRPAVLTKLDDICARQPTPHVVVACEGSNQHRASILHIVNARPFRLVNMLAGDAATALTDALRDAAHWYGGNEYFAADNQYVHQAAQHVDWQALDQQFGYEPSSDTADQEDGDKEEGDS